MPLDSGMHAALLDAGLVDPSGNFTSEPNFGEPLEHPDEPREPLREEPEQPEPGHSDAPDSQRPASQPQIQPVPEAPSGRPDNGPTPQEALQPDASRLGEEHDPIRAEYEGSLQALQQQAQVAFMYGRSLVDEQGQRQFTDEQLQQLIGQDLRIAQQQSYMGALMKRMQPVAKRAAAEKIASDHGVDVSDILDEDSPIAMQTKAKTIAQLRREGKFVERKNGDVDGAEGSRNFNNALPEGLDKLSPQQKMYVGLARGDR